jgi:hypothetical protein
VAARLAAEPQPNFPQQRTSLFRRPKYNIIFLTFSMLKMYKSLKTKRFYRKIKRFFTFNKI